MVNRSPFNTVYATLLFKKPQLATRRRYAALGWIETLPPTINLKNLILQRIEVKDKLRLVLVGCVLFFGAKIEVVMATSQEICHACNLNITQLYILLKKESNYASNVCSCFFNLIA
jgi:hypothetical protein